MWVQDCSWTESKYRRNFKALSACTLKSRGEIGVIVKWMLPICDKHKELFVAHNAKYHCFTSAEKGVGFRQTGVSLCGKYMQDMNYDTDIASGQILSFPVAACQKCFKKWKKEFQIE